MEKKKSKKWLWIALFSILTVLILAAIYKAKSKPKGEDVTVEQVGKKTILETVSASGKVFPEIEVKISSDVSGEVVELLVNEGDSVVAGQILARIDADSYVSTVEQGQAGLNNAKSQLEIAKSQIESSKAQKLQILAQLENARSIHNRNTQLKKDGVISSMEFDQSLANLKNLEANLQAAEAAINSATQSAKGSEFMVQSSEANLKVLNTNLRRTTLLAPASGIISNLSIEKGERVVGTIQMAGTEMMRIANLNTMEVQVEVSENDIISVSLGDEVDIEVDAYLDKKFKGIVTQIANSASNISSITGTSLNTDQVTNFIVKIRMSPESYMGLDKKYPFRPGMSASVEIFTDKKEDVIAVPIMSVTTREIKVASKDNKDDLQDEDFEEVVFIVEADTLKKVKVVSGVQDDDFIQIIEGLSGGETIVNGPYSAISKKLNEGDFVNVKEEKETDKK
jgi:HlyD family secretion protein